MRICIDLSAAVHQRAGLGRYAHELTTALLGLDHDNAYTAFYNRAGDARVDPPLDLLPCVSLAAGDKRWRLSVLAAHYAGLAQDRLLPGIDLFHGTDHLLPHMKRVRTVFTVHDLTHALYPETHATLNRRYLELMMPRFLKADAVVADSCSTARDAARLYGLNQAQIEVVYPGVSARFAPASDEAQRAVRQSYGLPEQYILYLGTIEPRKNLLTLLDALAVLKGSAQGAPALVVVGRKGWLYETFFERIERLGLQNHVLLPGFVPDADLPALYSAARLFVYPSLYEGFGLPVLEAMACGVPVVCSNTSSLPEVAGDAALLVAPRDADALAEAIASVYHDRALGATMRDVGLAQAQRFSWRAAAKQMLAVYQRVMEG